MNDRLGSFLSYFTLSSARSGTTIVRGLTDDGGRRGFDTTATEISSGERSGRLSAGTTATEAPYRGPGVRTVWLRRVASTGRVMTRAAKHSASGSSGWRHVTVIAMFGAAGTTK